ncbi:hypothetical protein TNCV_4992401 [Trichonephila clavipes]|nr:hypothetical protein TNCV_4992401 [Trichonephila clavipes]
MRGRIIERSKKGEKITDDAREFDIAHSVVSRLWKSFKNTGMCSRRHGEVKEVRRLQKTDISSYQQKGTGAPQLSSSYFPHVRLFRGAVGDKFVFYGRQRFKKSSNTRCSGLSRRRGYSTSRMASAFSRSNPIENVWDALGRQVAGRNYPPTNKNTLIRALTEEWEKLPQQLLDNVVQSMVRRVECCITLHGGHIPY